MKPKVMKFIISNPGDEFTALKRHTAASRFTWKNEYFKNSILIVKYYNGKALFKFVCSSIYNFSRNIIHYSVSDCFRLFNLSKNVQVGKNVEVINPGFSYIVHPKAKEYGCTNFNYGRHPEKNTVYKVILSVLINNNSQGYIIESKTGLQYLIDKSGLVLSSKKIGETIS